MDETKKTDFGAGISRRTFLHSLGALALTACGGGGGSGSGAAAVARASSMALGDVAVTTFARAATGQPSVTTSGSFVHPGLLHTQADFARMAQKVNAQAQPWYDGWRKLIGNGHTSLSWQTRETTQINRGGSGAQNYLQLSNDIAAAYDCALYWKIAGNEDYAKKAVDIMNRWSSTLQVISGDSNAALAAGTQGYEFAVCGEIMRGYSGWAAADFARFQGMMTNVFYPINSDFLNRHNGTDITHYWANWDLCNMASIMAIGVLTDNRAMFDTAINYYLNGLGNGAIAQAVYYVHPGYLGQWQESGRDQGHNTLGIALAGPICEMAWNQGIDLYGYDNNRFLAGAEYVAKANLVQPDGTYLAVPYEKYANFDGSQPNFSTDSQGLARPCWALVYNHYVNRMGLAAPWSRSFALAIQSEGGANTGDTSGGFDQLGYGTLTYTRDPAMPAPTPSGLTAWPSAGQVVLSWWGVANGMSYNIKRAPTAGGPYATVASGITDLLTYTDSPASGTWYYVVSSTTASGESANSNEAVAVTAVQLHTYLTFDETSGTNAADGSGNGHAGTLVGGASRQAGKIGNALLLDGTSGYVSLPNDIVGDISDFSIAAWVYRNSSSTKQWERIFDFGSGTTRYMYLSPNARGTVRFAITLSGGSNERIVAGAGPLPAGQWTHVAVTLLGTTLTLYVNGSQVGQTTGVAFTPWRLGSTAQNWIGRSEFSADPYFNGAIDEFRIYRGALPADQIAALAKG